MASVVHACSLHFLGFGCYRKNTSTWAIRTPYTKTKFMKSYGNGEPSSMNTIKNQERKRRNCFKNITKKYTRPCHLTMVLQVSSDGGVFARHGRPHKILRFRSRHAFQLRIYSCQLIVWRHLLSIHCQNLDGCYAERQMAKLCCKKTKLDQFRTF